MKSYISSQIRNVALLAHGGVGKTTITERLLYDSKVVSRLGRVEDGTTVADFLPEEVSRKITISTSLIPIEFNNYKINFVDTPGFSDFIGEVETVIPVVEGAVLLVCGVAGVQVQTEIIWEKYSEYQSPSIVFINKLERENADYNKVLNQLNENLEGKFAPLTIPIGKEDQFSGIVDLLMLKAYEYCSGQRTEIAIPQDMIDEVESYRRMLIEAAVETDEELMLKYLEDEEISQDELISGFRAAVREGLTPVLAGSALLGIGTDLLLDKIVKYIPSPDVIKQDMEPQNAVVARVFKTLVDPYIGKLSFIKVLNGDLHQNTPVVNVTQAFTEKIGQLLFMMGKQQIATENVVMGDIAVIPKLMQTRTGDTIASDVKVVPIEKVEVSEPNYQIAVVPKTKNDEDKLGSAINRLLEEDLSLRIFKHQETKETIFAGLGELHIDITIDKLKRRYGVEVDTQIPRVPYRETIKGCIKIEGKHKKQSGGHGQYGHVWLDLSPGASDFEFSQEIFGGSVPKQYIPAVEKGIIEAMQEGVLAGFPVTGIKAILKDGSYHNVDSSELAFKIAAAQAFKKGAMQATPVLLEPIMDVDILVPEQFTGDIISDLNSRRGRVMGMEPQDTKTLIKAQVPLAEMQKYAIELRSLTQGRGRFVMTFATYEEVPPKLSEEVIGNYKTS